MKLLKKIMAWLIIATFLVGGLALPVHHLGFQFVASCVAALLFVLGGFYLLVWSLKEITK